MPADRSWPRAASWRASRWWWPGIELLPLIYDDARRRRRADDPAKHDGDRCADGEVIATVRGRARTLLECERVALNFLQRLSGVATAGAPLCRRRGRAPAARCSIPARPRPACAAWRKLAAAAGGVTNHRMGLYDAILIKNNHIAAAGGVRKAIERARATRAADRDRSAHARGTRRGARRAAPTHLLLDNLTPDEAAEWIREIAGRAKVELSGGITLDNVRAYAETGADFVSSGAITHSARAVDISFRLELV